MGSIRRHVHIAASADDVWHLVGDPARLHEWFPVTSSEMTAADTRVVTLASGLRFTEHVVTHDHDQRRFQYRIVGTPLVTEHLGTLDVIDDGPDRCTVVYSTDMQPDAMALVIGGAAAAGLRQLKERFEGDILEGTR